MYKVYCNDQLLYNDGYETLKIHNAKLTLEAGKTGLFEFTIYQNHPHYDEAKEMIAMVEVYQGSEVIFYGRVFNIKYGFFNEKQVSCEGELAFLLDTVIEPHTWNQSLYSYFSEIVRRHNLIADYDKRFTAGEIQVDNITSHAVVENLNYVNTLETLNKHVVEPSGGYLSVRHQNGTKYLDLLSYTENQYDTQNQKIMLGRNLIDIARESNSEDVFTIICPLGAKEEESEIRIDVKNVNSGSPYIENEDAIDLYGRIYRQVIFDNITYPQTLYNTAAQYLEDNYAGQYTLEITAADLSAVDSSLDSFRVGQWVDVVDNVHLPDNGEPFFIQKMSIDLMNPADTKITIGKTKKGLTENILSEGESSGSGSGEQQPYLIETGTTGIWKWSKFSDGTGEFFGKIPVIDYAVTSALGNWYKGDSIYAATAYAYPFQMTEAPALEMMFQTRNGLGGLAWVYSQDAETAQSYLPQCYLIRPTTASGIRGNINIIGKGKL